MNWTEQKVAYTPYNKDLTAPGDRRRFVFYAVERNVRFELADPLRVYDIIYLTYGCNLSIWIKYKINHPNVKFVFELVDSYLFEDITIRSVLRGVARFLLGKERKLWPNYKTALRKMIAMSDAVVCSTYAQKIDLLRLNDNVHISLDFFSNDITHHKDSFEIGKKLKLVWEGQAYTVNNLLMLNDVFEKLGDKIELYIITDPIIKLPISFFHKKTEAILKKLKCDYYLVSWDKRTFSEIISNADLALIPIRRDIAMMWNKPENKLLLLWEIGVPTLTSDTPAYRHAMDNANLAFCCASTEEWLSKIEQYINSSVEIRRDIFEKAGNYLRKYHNKDEILRRWDLVFESLEKDVGK